MVFCGLLLGSSLTVSAQEKVTPSTKNYGLELQGAKNLYLCNKVPVDLKVGSKFFMTYTVTQLESDLSVQSGVVITRDSKADYPYLQGSMNYLQYSALLNEGTTYFYRFEMKEDGLACITSWAKGDKAEYIGLSLKAGEVTDGCKYFGVWFGGSADTNIVGRLTRIRCYDENGKDLGIDIGGYGAAAKIYDPDKRAALQPNKNIKDKYTITLNENYNVAISNRKYTESDVVYMEYTVKSVTLDNLWHSGVICTYQPSSIWPNGFWRYEEYDKENYQGCRLLMPGVTYIICFEKTEKGMDVLLKYKVNGEYVYYEYSKTNGEVTEGCGFFSIWFGEGLNSRVSAELVDFKCYDKDGKNLGVRVNNDAKIIHQGGLEDYSECLAAYYNADTNCFIWLNDEQNASIVTGETEVTGSYVIDGTSLVITTGDTTREYYYVYKYIKDSEGNKYIRLKDNKVRFVSGVVSGKTVQEITVGADTGYKLTKPETPTMEGNTFVAWCYADGTEFNFDTVITKAITLYAKWQDGDGNTFIAVDAESKKIDPTWFIIGGSCVLLVALTVTGSILVVKRKQKVTKGGNHIE